MHWHNSAELQWEHWVEKINSLTFGSCQTSRGWRRRACVCPLHMDGHSHQRFILYACPETCLHTGSYHNLLHPLGHTREGFIILWGMEKKMAALLLLSFPTVSPCSAVTPLGQSSCQLLVQSDCRAGRGTEWFVA